MDGVERSAEDSKSGQCQIRGAPKDKDEGVRMKSKDEG